MIFNPVIIGALFVQNLISKASKVAGAIVGFAITTGIMVWGLFIYSEGSQIALFGIPLSQEAFIMACIVWYGFDTKSFLAAKKVTENDTTKEVMPADSWTDPSLLTERITTT